MTYTQGLRQNVIIKKVAFIFKMIVSLGLFVIATVVEYIFQVYYR